MQRFTEIVRDNESISKYGTNPFSKLASLLLRLSGPLRLLALAYVGNGWVLRDLGRFRHSSVPHCRPIQAPARVQIFSREWLPYCPTGEIP